MEHLAPACHRLIAGGVALHDGIARHPEGRLGVQLRQHIGKIHVACIVEGRVARLVVAVVLPCHAAAVLRIVHQGKQLSLIHISDGLGVGVADLIARGGVLQAGGCLLYTSKNVSPFFGCITYVPRRGINYRVLFGIVYPAHLALSLIHISAEH